MWALEKIVIENISEDALKKRYSEYMSHNDHDEYDSCEVCKLPKLFHIELRPCAKYTDSEYSEIWTIFSQKIRHIRKWYNEIKEKREEKKIKYLNEFTTLTEDIINGDKNLEDLQVFITNMGDIELEPIESQKITGIVKLIISQFMDKSSEDLEVGSDGRMSRTQPKELKPEEKELEKDEKEQEINSKCVQCSKEFDNLEELRIHEKNCYICEQCNNWYESKEDLEYHRSRRHKEYNCDQCDNYGYESKEELDDHIRRRHTKYNCDQCDNWYKCRKELEDHRERRHKEYNCD